jgi:hypothetical protein
MNDGVDAFRFRLQKELGLSIGPKDPLLAQWLSQKELLEENAAEHQRLLSEFEAALGRNQITWSERSCAVPAAKHGWTIPYGPPARGGITGNNP